jgi:hypothetical protein
MSDAPPPSPGAGASSHQHHQHGRSHSGHKHSTKRPEGIRHGSDWIAKLHKKHDSKHHSSRERDEEEHAALLAAHSTDPEDEDAASQQAQSAHRWTMPRPIRSVANATKKAAQGTAAATQQGAQKVAQATRSAGKATGRAARRTGSAVKNNPKRGMGAVIVLLTGILTAISTIYGLHVSWDKLNTLCLSADCVRAADNILRNINPLALMKSSVPGADYYIQATDPCTNFDQFVCGNFEKHHDFRDDQGHVDAGTPVSTRCGPEVLTRSRYTHHLQD